MKGKEKIMLANKTFKTLNREVRQLGAILPLAMPEALAGRGIICRKVKEHEIELLLSFLKGGDFRMAKFHLRHLLCKCGWWQVIKAINLNLELRMRVWLLFPVIWE